MQVYIKAYFAKTPSFSNKTKRTFWMQNFTENRQIKPINHVGLHKGNEKPNITYCTPPYLKNQAVGDPRSYKLFSFKFIDLLKYRISGKKTLKLYVYTLSQIII